VKVREIAYEVRETYAAEPQTVDVHLDWNEMSPSVRLVVDQERARALGLNVPGRCPDAANAPVRHPGHHVREGIEKVGAWCPRGRAERLDLGRIGDLTIVSRGGVPVPVSQVARLEYTHEEPILWRRNRDMAITVRSDVIDGVQPPDVTNAIWPTLQNPSRTGWSRPTGWRSAGRWRNPPRRTPRCSRSSRSCSGHADHF
jgi:multidrug efflux pump subunit AcrB